MSPPGCSKQKNINLGKVRFLLGGEERAGASEGRVISESEH